ncbi:DUF2335 domain-containing protein [Angustibacter sp. Root456]|uniref:DUF2335 domain-containing protein n=1 Tax=Angustibacter sp. Root456 TaxID=1736539 RepID=UPI0006FC550F|nr:DUF2335 domain-containing protein [Angustibacter sp. Root456]KQX66578.1 hypothetical protein ASD06_04215 [Angustibacter sp. Root456]
MSHPLAGRVADHDRDHDHDHDTEPATAPIEVTDGELPPADTVEAYEHVLPGAADRIIRMLEQQSEHRMALERSLARSTAVTERLRQVLGVAIVLVVFIVATRLITGGHEGPGTLLAVADLVLLAAVFLGRPSAPVFVERPRLTRAARSGSADAHGSLR